MNSAHRLTSSSLTIALEGVATSALDHRSRSRSTIMRRSYSTFFSGARSHLPGVCIHKTGMGVQSPMTAGLVDVAEVASHLFAPHVVVGHFPCVSGPVYRSNMMIGKNTTTYLLSYSIPLLF